MRTIVPPELDGFIFESSGPENLLILTCGTWDNAFRFVPPLVVMGEQIEDGLARFGRAVARVLG